MKSFKRSQQLRRRLAARKRSAIAIRGVEALESRTMLAVTLTWDANAAVTPNPSNGNGVWQTSASWWNGSSNASWVDGSDATLGVTGTSGSYSVQLTGNARAGTLQFSGASDTKSPAHPH